MPRPLAILVMATFQSWIPYMPAGESLQRSCAQAWLYRRLLRAYQRRVSTPRWTSCSRLATLRVSFRGLGRRESLRTAVLRALGGGPAPSPRLGLRLVHCRRFRVALWWTSGPMVFPDTASWAPEDHFATDGCPWGFAGVLFESFKPVAWYATPLTKNDLRKFRVRIGESKHNTTWEALALLVAVRLWLRGTRVLARVKADSLSALRSVVQLTSESADLNLVARELVLDAVLGLYTVELATHIPGVSNRLPDELSWMWTPEPHPLPQPLQRVPRQCSPVRDRWFWN